MILEVSWDGLRTLSFGLLKFHSHGSWLVCKVASDHEIVRAQKRYPKALKCSVKSYMIGPSIKIMLFNEFMFMRVPHT